jgi:hypothetical protein
MLRVLGVPPIALAEARRRVGSADSLVIGGLVCLLAWLLQLAALHVAFVGTGLFLAGGFCGRKPSAVRSAVIGGPGAPSPSVLGKTVRAGSPHCSPALGVGYAPKREPPRSAELQSAIDRACSAVERSSPDISAAHLLLEILQTESVISILGDLHARVDDVTSVVRALVPVPQVANPVLS